MNERQITLITLAFLALFIIGGGLGVWYLQFNVLTQKEANLADLQKKVKTAETKKGEVKGLRVKVNALRKTEMEEVQRIPNLDTGEYDGFVDQLNQMRRQSGVFIKDAKVSKGKRAAVRGRGAASALPADVDKISYDVTVAGNFYPLLRFINLIETNKRYIQIDTATIRSASSRTGSASLREMKISLSTYSFKSKGGEKKKDEPVDESKVIDSTPLPN